MNHKRIIYLTQLSYDQNNFGDISQYSNSKMPEDDGQGRNQTSEQDEVSFEPLVGSGGMPPQKILKSRGSEMLL